MNPERGTAPAMHNTHFWSIPSLYCLSSEEMQWKMVTDWITLGKTDVHNAVLRSLKVRDFKSGLKGLFSRTFALLSPLSSLLFVLALPLPQDGTLSQCYNTGTHLRLSPFTKLGNLRL